MLHFLPLTVVFDIENPHVVPKLKPGDRMRHQCLGALVFRINQIVLRVDLILGFGAGKLRQQILFFDAPFRELDADFTDLVGALGLV